jgi:hypothetical protein
MPSPAGPAASNQTERTAKRPKTTSPMPTASRAHGERICRVGVRAGFRLVLRCFFVAVRFLDDGEARRAGARRAVFWGTYTSMITGKMTGLRWVTS